MNKLNLVIVNKILENIERRKFKFMYHKSGKDDNLISI